MTRIDKRIDKRCVKRAWFEQWREVRPPLLFLCACLVVLILVYR